MSIRWIHNTDPNEGAPEGEQHTGQKALSHGMLNLAQLKSHGAMTVSNQRRDKIRSALKISSYGCGELMQQQVRDGQDHNG